LSPLYASIKFGSTSALDGCTSFSLRKERNTRKEKLFSPRALINEFLLMVDPVAQCKILKALLDSSLLDSPRSRDANNK
jgi:hypothetical protein